MAQNVFRSIVLVATFLTIAQAASPALGEIPGRPVATPLGMTGVGTEYAGGAPIRQFALAFGDQCPALAAVMDRLRTDGPPFAYDWTMYKPNGDGTWRLCRARMPKRDDLMGPPDPAGALERRRFEQFLLDHPNEVMDWCAPTDFGEPDDFIYRRARWPQDKLPVPLKKVPVSSDLLGGKFIDSIFQHNSDGTIVIYLRAPFDREGPAKEIYRRLQQDIEPGAEARPIVVYPTCDSHGD